MRRAIFHIGTPKTGTTSIQRTLRANHHRLIKSGILYPQSALIGSSHANLAYELSGSYRYRIDRGGWRELEHEFLISGCNTLIVSSENLLGYNSSNIVANRIATFARDTDAAIDIVAYIRPQYEYIDSLYAQNASGGSEVRKFYEYIMSACLNKSFDYYCLFKPWYDIFGDKVRIRLFSSISGENIVNNFLCDLGLSLKINNDEASMIANERASVRTVEYVRKSAELVRRFTNRQERRVIARKMRRLCIETFPQDAKFSGMSMGLADLIEDYFRDGNSALFEMFQSYSKVQFPSVKERSFNATMIDLDVSGAAEISQFMSMYSEVLVRWSRDQGGTLGSVSASDRHP